MTSDSVRTALWKVLEGIDFYPMERKIIDLLADGVARPVTEVLKVLNDPQADKATLQVHISYIRKKIGPLRHEIVCEFRNRQMRYRYVILLSSLSPRP